MASQPQDFSLTPAAGDSTPRARRSLAGRIWRVSVVVSLVPLLAIGGLVIWSSSGSAAQTGGAARLAGPIVLASAMLIAWIVAWLAARRIAAPLKELATAMRQFVAGNREQRAMPGRSSRSNEVGELFELFNQTADEYKAAARALSQREATQKDAFEEAFTQVLQAASRSNRLDELLGAGLQSLSERFDGLTCAAYLLEPGSGLPQARLFKAEQAPSLLEATRRPALTRLLPEVIELGSESAADWVGGKAIATRRAQVNGEHYLAEDGGYLEAAVPLVQGEAVLGVLDLFASGQAAELRMKIFSSRSLAELQKIANLLALGMAALGADRQTESVFSAAPQGWERPATTPPAPEASGSQAGELQMLWNVSQALSSAALESGLKPLFQTIHGQIEQVMGAISSFGIALYDDQTETIRIPYLVEEGALMDISPFPLGEGLTSILIRTQKPLLLVEDVEQKTIALGAKVAGAPALSWLGVPMIFGSQVIGAIIVQDVQRERRFNEEDQRLLSTLAAQVAVMVRHAQLLEEERSQAQRERRLNEASERIRRAAGMQEILKVTADELGATLGARRAHIRLGAHPQMQTAAPEASPSAEPVRQSEGEP